MKNIIQKHRAFVAGQIEKSFDSNLQSPAQEVEKAYSVGDEKDFNGRTYYVHELNSAGQPKWRLKDKKKKADNEKKFKDNFKDASDPRDKIAQDAGFKDYEEMRGYQNYVTAKNLLKKKSMQAKTKEDTKKELEANVAKYEKEHADVIKRVAERKAEKSKPAAVKIDETTIDQTEYDSQLKMAKQVDAAARSMAKNIIQGNIDKTKKKLKETIDSRPGAKVTIANLQKDLTKFVSQKKAVEDAIKG